MRRRLLQLAALSPLLWIGSAQAGSYLDSAFILVTEAAAASRYLRTRVGSRELARVMQSVAAARLEAASRMKVPKEVVQAHPHLLLTLQNHERAADAVAEGHPQRFVIYEARAQNEEVILRGVLKQLGYPLAEAK